MLSVTVYEKGRVCMYVYVYVHKYRYIPDYMHTYKHINITYQNINCAWHMQHSVNVIFPFFSFLDLPIRIIDWLWNASHWKEEHTFKIIWKHTHDDLMTLMSYIIEIDQNKFHYKK